MTIETLKLLHLLGVILFLGNILVTAWWKLAADRTRNPVVIAHAQRQVIVTDGLFTSLGAALIGGTGLAMVNQIGWDILDAHWLRWGIGLFIASGVVWIAVLVPTQIAQMRLARGFATGSDIPDAYWKLARRWALFGAVATALPFLNLYWMVFKG